MKNFNQLFKKTTISLNSLNLNNQFLLSKKSFANYFKKIKNPEKIYKYRRYDGSYEKEKEEFIHKYKETRKELVDTFWKEHSVIEKEYLDDFYESQLELKKENQIKDVDFIISQAWKCAKETNHRKEAHDRFYAKQKAWRLEDSIKKDDQQGLLNLMDRQAENWLTIKNFNQKIPYVIDELLPPTVISHNDYYSKLSAYAVLVDSGELEKAEELKRGDFNIEEKNSILEPLFINLKKMIKSISKTNENKYVEAYSIIERKLKNAYNTERGEGKDLLDNFKSLFKKMVEIQRQINENDSNKLIAIEHTLQNLINLIITWNKYVEILYMTADAMQKNIDELGISRREIEIIPKYDDDEDANTTDEYITKKKLEFLNNISTFEKKETFLKAIQKQGKDVVAESKNETKKYYNEDSENSENIKKKKKVMALLESANAQKTNKKANKDVGKKQVEEEKQVEAEKQVEVEEIDEEEMEIVDNDDKYFSEKIISDITSMYNIEDNTMLLDNLELNLTQKKLFNDEDKEDEVYKPQPKLKKSTEDFLLEENIKEENDLIDKYFNKDDSSKIVDEKDNNSKASNHIKNTVKERENILKRHLKHEALSDTDYNLIFETDLGEIINLEDLKQEKGDYALDDKESYQKKLKGLDSSFLKKLFNQLDNQKNDFPVIDLYDNNLIQYLEFALISYNKINEEKLTTSIVMKFLENELNSIKDNMLSPEQILKKKHFLKLVKLVSYVPIQDAQNFKKIYDLYKIPLANFV